MLKRQEVQGLSRLFQKVTKYQTYPDSDMPCTSTHIGPSSKAGIRGVGAISKQVREKDGFLQIEKLRKGKFLVPGPSPEAGLLETGENMAAAFLRPF